MIIVNRHVYVFSLFSTKVFPGMKSLLVNPWHFKLKAEDVCLQVTEAFSTIISSASGSSQALSCTICYSKTSKKYLLCRKIPIHFPENEKYYSLNFSPLFGSQTPEKTTPMHFSECVIDVSFSCVCPVIDYEFRHNIVKVAEAITEWIRRLLWQCYDEIHCL